MTTQTPSTRNPSMFTEAQWRTLDTLRARYQQERDLFSTCELARLRFLRWLYHTGRITT